MSSLFLLFYIWKPATIAPPLALTRRLRAICPRSLSQTDNELANKTHIWLLHDVIKAISFAISLCGRARLHDTIYACDLLPGIIYIYSYFICIYTNTLLQSNSLWPILCYVRESLSYFTYSTVVVRHRTVTPCSLRTHFHMIVPLPRKRLWRIR